MKTKIKLFISFIITFIFMLSISISNSVAAAEIITTDWIVNKKATDLTVSNVEDGGVATVSYYTANSNTQVTLKVTNYDIVDNFFSIKYQSDFPA